MKHKLIIILTVTLGTFFNSDGFAQKNKKDKKNKSGDIIKSPEANSKSSKIAAEALFLEGMGFFIRDDYKEALELFLKSEVKNQESASIKYQIALTYFELGQNNNAIPYAEKSIELDSKNEFYYVLLAKLYESKEKYEKAIQIYEQLIKNVANTNDYYFDIAAAYLNMSKYEEAIDIYNKLEEEIGVSESIFRQKQRIYLTLNQIDKALIEGQKLIDYFPDEPEFQFAQVRLLIAAKRLEEATKLLDGIDQDAEYEGKKDLLRAEIAKFSGDDSLYENSLEEAFKSNELSYEQKLSKLAEYLEQGQQNAEKREKGLTLAKIVVETHPEVAQTNEVYADFLVLENRLEEARNFYLKSTQINADNFRVWNQLISVDWSLQQYDSVALHSENAIEVFPNQVSMYIYNGSSNYFLKNYEEAMYSLEQGKLLSTSDEITLQLEAQLGDVYHNMEEYEKSDASYEAVLEKDADNLHVLNNYSYFLSVRNENLDRAKELGKKLIDLAPENATYLDTYGWILYTSGDYKKAHTYLEKAAKNSQNATIVEHYGDVLYKLGEVEAAIEQWKKAKELGSENNEALEKKLSTGKLID